MSPVQKGNAMTNAEILRIAMEQSAIDLSCAPEDFRRAENVVVLSRASGAARRYLRLPFDCNLVSYGSNVVASVSGNCRELVSDYVNRYRIEDCFETPHMHVLGDALAPLGLKLCYMAEYFLPDLTVLQPRDCPYETRLLHPADFRDLYVEAWSNALCEKRKELDVLGVGAYDGGRLIGLAGCSADCETMWQIGIDVLPEYRRRGVASALTSRLATEIVRHGKVPFYCAAWSNVRSVRNAIRSGFRPAWVELTARPAAEVDGMNRPDNPQGWGS